VLLAFDWPEGGNHDDFLGFAIRRNPGYGRAGAGDLAPADLARPAGDEGEHLLLGGEGPRLAMVGFGQRKVEQSFRGGDFNVLRDKLGS